MRKPSKKMDIDVILTCDATLMSNHHGKEFLGFGTSAPPNWIPEWLYKWLFFPRMKKINGLPWQAPYGLRKLEAKLIDEGINALVLSPDDLGRYEAKVIGIYVMDAFGWGPSSTTFAGIMGTGEPYLAKYFRKLLESRGYKKLKERGAKTIVGGPAAWQFKYKPDFMEKYGIDCVFDGEGEMAIELIKKAIEGEEIPKFYEINEAPPLEEISEIKRASINGLVEIGRGCPRKCKFCSVTLRPLRWYPLEKIEKEIKVNVNAGVEGGILHAEDVLLYGQRGVVPNEEKLIKLHKMAKKHYESLAWSHASFAAVAAKPKLIEKLAEIICDEKQDWWGAEMGIETGSPRLMKKIMPAKAKPFKPEEYPDVVREAAGILTDNNMIPACTLIAGLPEEEEEDVIKTIELIEDLKDFKALIVPLFFVPMGKLKDRDWFKKEEMKEIHKELLIKCMKHDMMWIKKIANEYFGKKKKLLFLKPFYILFTKIVEWQAKKKGIFNSMD
ncbi:MAG: B12-binding domain-containing radical SAM protein [Thermoplasmata archaeon]|nr:B12-binding domain-containing radical SAM protein [Thermoplasmata archaeon]